LSQVVGNVRQTRQVDRVVPDPDQLVNHGLVGPLKKMVVVYANGTEDRGFES
jgi:hypothetical protein